MTDQDFYLTVECTVKNKFTEDSFFDLSEALQSVYGTVAATPGGNQFSASITVTADHILTAVSAAQHTLTMAAGRADLIDTHDEIVFDTIEVRTKESFDKWLDETDSVAVPELRLKPHLSPEYLARLIEGVPDSEMAPALVAAAKALCVDFYTAATGGPAADPEELWAGTVGRERTEFIRDAAVAVQAYMSHNAKP